MACINPDGTVTASARRILTAACAAVTAAEIAATTGLPLYRVRSSLRELVQAQLLHENGVHYVLTETGKTRITVK